MRLTCWSCGRWILWINHIGSTGYFEYHYSQPLNIRPSMKILGIDNLTDQQINEDLQNGGKFVIYRYTISIIILTFRRSSDVHFIRPGQNAVVKDDKIIWFATLDPLTGNPTDKLAIRAQHPSPVCHPWDCLAIRGHNHFPRSATVGEKNLRPKKNVSLESCTPLRKATIFLSFYFFAFLLDAAEGRAEISVA